MPDISGATLLAAVKAIFEADKKLREKTKGFDPFKKATNKYLEGVLATCDRMKIFGMTQPVKLQGIYVRVNILEKLTRLARLTPEELEEAFGKDRRGFGKLQAIEPRLGLEMIKEKPKLFVLGKPGAGKTTFLKYTALQALRSDTFDEPHIPVFIRLREWAEMGGSLLDFIGKVFDTCGYPEAEAFVKRLLQQGHGLILLDGLDEVTGDRTKVIQEIETFCDKYRDNRFVLSCRIAAYDHVFESFTDVEMADFDDTQIQTFSSKWFVEQPQKAKAFWEKLNLLKNEPIKELARTPLLLTMLCLMFKEIYDIPKNRTELYEEAFNALLTKWDSSRSIERGGIYKKLGLKNKKGLLSYVAVQAFAQDQYFIRQERLESLIKDFIQHLPDVDAELLHADAEAVLKTIETQHGLFVERANRVYSFSHLTFQEYFTAVYIVDQRDEETLKRLIDQHIGDDKWLEVILLVAGMLPKADDFLFVIRKKISEGIDPKLADFLNEATSVVKPTMTFPQYESRVLSLQYLFKHAYYLAHRLALAHAHEFRGRRARAGRARALALAFAQDRVHDLASSLDLHFDLDLAHPHDRDHAHAIVSVLAVDKSLAYDLAVDLDRDTDLALALDINFTYHLGREIDLNLIDSSSAYLSKSQILVSCLNMSSYVSRETRQYLLDTLLLEPWTPPERSSKPEVLF